MYMSRIPLTWSKIHMYSSVAIWWLCMLCFSSEQTLNSTEYQKKFIQISLFVSSIRHCVVKTTTLLQYATDALIIRLVIVNGHYFYYRYRLFLKDVSDIVISVLVMSFLVIIGSLIAFMILIIIEKCRFSLKESETRR